MQNVMQPPVKRKCIYQKVNYDISSQKTLLECTKHHKLMILNSVKYPRVDFSFNVQQTGKPYYCKSIDNPLEKSCLHRHSGTKNA